MKFQSLQSRIVFFFVILMVAVQAISLLFVEHTSVRTAREKIGRELAIGERIVRLLLQQDRTQLSQAAGILASDFGFREAIASRDLETVMSALKNHGARINADAMMLVSMDHVVLADTLHKDTVSRTAQFPQLLRTAQRDGKASAIEVIDGHPYQLVVVPVLAPDPIGWVAMGFLLDDQFARELQQVTTLSVSFLTRTGSGPWEVVASTIPKSAGAELARSLWGRGAATTGAVTIGGEEFETLAAPLAQRDDAAVMVVLQRSVKVGMEPFQHLRQTLFVLAALSLVVTLVGSVVIARNIVRPIDALAAIARRMRAGDYSRAANVEHRDEIGALAASFNHMREGIAARESQITRLAYQDFLTTLPNRAMFTEQLEQAIADARLQATTVTIFVMDLDRFKIINDSLGHHVGDQILRAVAARLKALLRGNDTVARLGGDEFGMLLNGASAVRVRELAVRVLETLEQPITVDGQGIDVGASIGIATFPEHGEEPGALLRGADVAMYAAKRTHAGFAFYDRRHDQNRQDQLSLLSEIRRAAQQSEFVLYYQPKIDLPDGRIAGVEALIRWRHPTRGLVAPVEIIPFAEQTGVIRTVTLWVIGTACRAAGRWRERGFPLNVSINVSARDLMNRELPDIVAGALKDHRLDPGQLTLEITETALMEDPVHTEETLNRLNDLGVHVAIDDYGVGYCSLAYLKRLRVDELKIDRTFVLNMASQNKDAAIVRSTIDLAHNLGLSVVAEGCETREQFDLLQQMGCDQVQGMLISPPLTEAELEAWLRGPPAGGWNGVRPTGSAPPLIPAPRVTV